jgi:L-ribulose-5-phosphate 4-epimerase
MSATVIEETIVRYRNQAPAVLLAQHGVFTFGRTPRAAVKAAEMLEDVAKTCYLALSLGTPRPLPAAEVQKWNKRYHDGYGQSSGDLDKASSGLQGQ